MEIEGNRARFEIASYLKRCNRTLIWVQIVGSNSLYGGIKRTFATTYWNRILVTIVWCDVNQTRFYNTNFCYMHWSVLEYWWK